MRPYVSAVTSAVLLAGLATTASAESSAPLAHCSISVTTQRGLKLPPNLPALVLRDTSTQGARAILGEASLTPSYDGRWERRPDPRVAGDELLVPSKALSAETEYEGAIPFRCENVSTPDELSLNLRLQTGTTTALPSSIGSVAARLRSDRADEGVSVIEIAASPELAAYLPLTMFEVYDGSTLRATVPYGNAGTAEADIARFELRALESSCDANADADAVLTRSLEIRAHVAGAATDPAPLTANVPARCVRDPAPSPPRSDGGTDTPSSNASADDGGGCTVGASGTSVGAQLASFGLLVLVAAFVRRRPRRR